MEAAGSCTVSSVPGKAGSLLSAAVVIWLTLCGSVDYDPSVAADCD
jgi:hypothetical protein